MSNEHSSGVEIKAGQVWKTVGGEEVTIEAHHGRTYCWIGLTDEGEYFTYTDEGSYCCGVKDIRDLSKLVAESVKVQESPAELYSIDEIENACNSLGWSGRSLNSLISELEKIKNRTKNPEEYQKYLQLKQKFESLE